MNDLAQTILIVDDTETNIDILLELLDGYDIAVAMDGKAALEIVNEEHIDLILLDILMPEMDGYDVCKLLKANQETKDIPVIFITAKTDENSIETAYDVGGLDYVTKPFKAKELLARVKTQLDLKSQKEFVQSVLNSLEQIVITTNGDKLISGNASFMDFFQLKSIDEFPYQTIEETFSTDVSNGYLQSKIGSEHWLDFIIEQPSKQHKICIERQNQKYIFTVSATELPSKEDLKNIKVIVFNDVTVLEKAKLEIETLHYQTQDSIEYASIIQRAILPSEKILEKHFQDYFTLWQPKDTIGGDLYFAEEINENELLVMVIDCTGHGVPGAFVTMLVKALYQQVRSTLGHSNQLNPSFMLSQFNQNIKHLLHQENINSQANVGFDAVILHSNKSNNTVTFAGANLPLFVFIDNQLTMIKGDRHSIGYKQSNPAFEFTDHVINISSKTKLYITTDGYIDQTGGFKGFCYGNKNFRQLLEHISNLPFSEQKQSMLETLQEYENERKDDVTVIGMQL